jgi:4-hydroxybenzoate polyprenyltransferase
MNRDGKVHALLATARVANIPSVVCNVWLGVVMGWSRALVIPGPFLWFYAALLALAGVMLYVGGNFFNDWIDRAWDEKHRPERALPRGLFPASSYLAAAVVLMAGGVICAWIASGHAWSGGRQGAWVAMAIVFWIVVYTILHKRTAWAVIPMGLCRALLPVMGSMAFFPYVDLVWPVAAALFCYIMGLSLSARYEAMPATPQRVAVMARGLLLVTAAGSAWATRGFYLPPWLVVAGVMPYLLWTSLTLRIWRKPVPVLVSRLLAGIPWVDGMVLLPLGVGMLWITSESIAGSGLTCLLLPPLTFVAALLLQRLAPAT